MKETFQRRVKIATKDSIWTTSRIQILIMKTKRKRRETRMRKKSVDVR